MLQALIKNLKTNKKSRSKVLRQRKGRHPCTIATHNLALLPEEKIKIKFPTHMTRKTVPPAWARQNRNPRETGLQTWKASSYTKKSLLRAINRTVLNSGMIENFTR